MASYSGVPIMKSKRLFLLLGLSGLVIGGFGAAALFGSNAVKEVDAYDPNTGYDVWTTPDKSYYLVEKNGSIVEVNKKTGDFDFVGQSDNASYVRYVINAESATTGSITITNAWPTSQWNTMWFNGTRHDYNDSNNFMNTFNNLSFNQGLNTLIVNMHYTYGITEVTVSGSGLSIVNQHIADVAGDTYYANNLITEYSRLYYKDSRNNIFNGSFTLDRVIPDRGHPLVFTVNNSEEKPYLLDLSSWADTQKTIKYKIDNSSYQTVNVAAHTENSPYYIGYIGSGNHTVSIDTDENTPSVAVRKLYASSEPVETCTVSFDTNGLVDIDDVEVMSGGHVSAPSPVQTEYCFDTWYKDANMTQAFDFANDTVDEDITLYSRWNHTWIKEAENSSLSGSSIDSPYDGSNSSVWSNGAGVGGMNYSGSKITFTFNAPESGFYDFKVGACGSGGSTFVYDIDSTINGSAPINTGSWLPAELGAVTHTVSNIKLTKGNHIFEITETPIGNKDIYINFDFFKLELQELPCQAFYEYFMEKTEEECTTSVVSHNFSSDLWHDLSNRYGDLNDTNKDYLCDASVYGDLHERYRLIMANYHFEDNFLKDSNNQNVYPLGNQIINNDSTLPILVIIAAFGLVTVGSAFFFRRRKEQ